VPAAARADPDAGDLLMSGLFDRLQGEIDARGRQEGLSPIDLLDLPPELAAIIKKIVRKNGMSLAEIATDMGQSPAQAQKMLDELVQKGLMRRVEVQDEIWYKAHFARKPDKKLTLGVWSVLDSMLEEHEEQ
jgi:predicted transcriptional regulator